MELEKRIAELEKNQKEQNSYITKLEKENQELKQSKGSIDPNEYEFFKEKTLLREMKEDEAEARRQLEEEYGSEVYAILADKHKEFSKTQITPKTSSVQFFKSTFELVYAREMKKKDSDLFKHYNSKEEAPKPKDPEPNPTVQPKPPVVGADDPRSGDPNIAPKTVKNLDESYQALKATLAGEVPNPYE